MFVCVHACAMPRCVQGVKRQPVFVVARSPLLDVLTVSADTLAHAMKAAPQQVRV